MTVTIDVSTATLIRRLTFGLLVISVLLLGYYIHEALTLMAIAAFLALAVNKPINKLSEFIPVGGRKLATMVVFVAVGAVLSSIIALIIPLAINEGQELAIAIPGYIEQIRSGNTGFSRLLLRYDIIEYIETTFTSVASGLVSSVNILVDFVLRILSNLVSFIFTVVLAFLMAVEGSKWVARGRDLFPSGVEAHVSELTSRMYRAVTGFVNGQLIITSIAAISTIIVLSLAGMPAPLSLAAVIWVTGLIPLIGNTLGATVVIAVALSQSLLLALLLTGYYIIYQQVENNVFEPVVQSRTIKMTPLMVLLSALIGIHLAGFLGALLAIPAGACVKIAIDYVLKHPDIETALDSE